MLFRKLHRLIVAFGFALALAPTGAGARLLDGDNHTPTPAVTIISTTADTQITLSSTMSQRIAPGACVRVLALVDTNDFPANSLLTINLTARSNVTSVGGALAEDTGTIINAVGNGVRLTSPVDAELP